MSDVPREPVKIKRMMIEDHPYYVVEDTTGQVSEMAAELAGLTAPARADAERDGVEDHTGAR